MRKPTRREFVRAVSAWSVVVPLTARSRQRRSNAKPILAYAGTYSSRGGQNHGQGIHILELNLSNGALAPKEIVKSESNPSWLTFNRNRTHLYSANELADPNTGSGSVSSYTVDPASGSLTLLNTVSSEGAGPAHMSIHPAGKYALVANYGGGSVAVLPIQPDGRLGSASDVKRHQGTVGPIQPSSAPAGSFASSGHERPHAHMIEADPSGRFVLAADLGLDEIRIWRFDEVKGVLLA